MSDITTPPTFEMGWAPLRYPGPNLTDNGSWTGVMEDDQAVGYIWTNWGNGAGVVWIDQTPSIVKLIRHFTEAVEANTTANYAYLGAQFVPGVTLKTENSGTLQQMMDELHELGSYLD